MNDFFEPVVRRNLSDDLAYRIKQLIEANNLVASDKLPTISEMADRFGVGPPTLREALKKLETLGVVRIKHGSGIYVGENHRALFLTSPVIAGEPSKEDLLDLIEVRTAVEPTAARLAAEHATSDDVQRMKQCLDEEEAHLEDDRRLKPTNMAFHREIAKSSGNKVMSQMLQVLSKLFQREQKMIFHIYGSREKDLREHRHILEGIRESDPDLAEKRMRAHLDAVRATVETWNPEETQLNNQAVDGGTPT